MDRDNCLDIRLLGRLEVHFGERILAFPTRHAGFLIALLALEGSMRREIAASRLWGERDEAQARASLRQTIYHIQKVFASAGAPELEVTRQTISLKERSFQTDVDSLLDSLEANPTSAVKTYRGEILGAVGRVDPAFQDWLDQERRSIGMKISEAASTAAGRRHSRKDWAGLEAVSALGLKIDPFNEEALRHRMEALVHMDRRASALAIYEDFKEGLQAALGIEPETVTQDFRDQIANWSAEPAPAPDPVPSASTEVTFRERRSVSLLAVTPSEIATDPEEFATDFALVSTLLKDTLQDGSAQILEQAGSAIACVFGASGLVERHAEAAVHTASALAGQTGDALKLAVVSGDIIDTASDGTDDIDLTVLAPLLAEANALLQTAEPGRSKLSPATSSRLSARPTQKSFIAREAELDALKSAFAQSQFSQAQVVGIVGEAGIGKSTLLRQFLRACEGAEVLTIEGYDREASRSFGAIARFLAARIFGGENPSRASVDAAIAERHIRDVHREVLLDLLGLATEAERHSLVREEQRLRIFKLAREVILRACENGEAILAVEDVHWLDRDSAEFLDRLIGEISAYPLTVVTTFRPEYQVSWIGRSSFRLLRLTPLAHEDAEAMISPWVKGLSENIREKILKRAAGNPFLLVETARAVSAGGKEALDDVPATIRDILNATVHRLSSDSRRVLQCAAVLGFEAPDSAVAALTGYQETRLDDALAALRQEELVVRSGYGSSSRHRFRHALLHEAIYATIPKTDSKSLHASASAHLRERPDIDPAAIAHHAWCSEDWREAVEWYHRAGDRFAMLSSYALASEAYGYAVDALAKCQDHQDSQKKRLELALKRRPVLVPLGLYETALTELDTAETLAERIDSRSFRVAVHISKSYLFSTHGYLKNAITHARHATALSDQEEQTAYEAKLAEGQALSLMGDWQTTIALLAPTVPYWEEHRHERFGHTGTRSVWCHGHLSNAFGLNGQTEAALRHAERAFDLAGETKRPLDTIFSLHLLGRAQNFAGNSEEALSLLMEALQRAEEIDAPIFRSWFACDAFPLLLARGRIDEASILLNRQIEVAQQLKLRQFHGWLRLNKSELLRANKRCEEAEAEAAAALRSARDIGDLVLEPTALKVLAQYKSETERHHAIEAAQDLAAQRGLSILR
ncbi:AAA family ATPase [Roseibium sp. HPY-6]|uniref:AAA family ATPase n=1 Tax=Roseibium sp. HPY-6 TaxID=3229852 RepID=UPI00338EDAD2